MTSEGRRWRGRSTRRSIGVGNSQQVAGALLEAEEKVKKRKLATAPNPERGRDKKREG